MQDKDYKSAETLHVGLMVDHTAEVSQLYDYGFFKLSLVTIGTTMDGWSEKTGCHSNTIHSVVLLLV